MIDRVGEIVVPEQIQHEVFIAAPVDRVWSLLTEPEHIAVWYALDGAEVDLRVGGAILFRRHERGDFHARVQILELGSRFAYRLALIADAQPAPGNSTLVEFSLDAEPGGTRLRVVQSGFADLDGTDAERAQHAEVEAESWRGGLAELRSYATTYR